MAFALNVSRRRFFEATSALLLSHALDVDPANALARIPYGGRLELSLPWGTEQLDPHDLNDPLAGFFGEAVFDSLYAIDARGQPYPALAAAEPEALASGVGVRLRPDLKTATGKALRAVDLEYSLRRAGKGGAYALLHEFGVPSRDRRDKTLVVFPRGSPRALASALSSPLTAIVRIGYDPRAPDGTGAFRAVPSRAGLRLMRNERAARGPAYLDGIEVSRAPDLAEALRRFEAREVDIGWLGRGLHRSRPGSSMFESRELGWFLLHTGKRLGRWGAPGTAQQLLQAIAPEQLHRFGITLPRASGSAARYGGPSAELVTRDDSPQLLELGRTLAQLLSSPGSEIAVRGENPAALRRLVSSGDFHFALDVVRSLGPTRQQQQLSLLSVASPSLAKAPPRLPASLRGEALALSTLQATRTGLIGSFRVVGARMGAYAGLPEWNLRQVWKKSEA